MSDDRNRDEDHDDDMYERRRPRDRDRDEYDDDNRRRSHDADDDRRSPPFPGKLRAAGRIWIVFGILILVNGAINLATGLNRGNDKAAVVAGPCVVIVVALLGGIFIHVGMQSVNGTARDTLGNSIGSLIIALLPGAAGVFALMLAVIEPLIAVMAVLNLAASAGLITAGVLALMAREDYLEWKRYNRDSGSKRPSRRSRYEDDDRDDRRR